jgi:hypothetical protein
MICDPSVRCHNPSMKNLLRSTFVKRLPALLLAAGILCAAGTSAIAADMNPSILAVNRSASLSYVRTSMYYNEPDDGQFLGTGYFDYEKGTLNGGQLAFSYTGPRGLYLNAAWNQAKGTVDYNGFTGTTPVQLNSRATTKELDLKIGKGFATQDEQWMFTPYLAGGRRHWKRDLAIGTSGEFTETYDF